MRGSAPETIRLQAAADRAPSHSVQRFVSEHFPTRLTTIASRYSLSNVNGTHGAALNQSTKMKTRMTVEVPDEFNPSLPLTERAQKNGWRYHWLVDQSGVGVSGDGYLHVGCGASTVLSVRNNPAGRAVSEVLRTAIKAAQEWAADQVLSDLAAELGCDKELLSTQLKRRSNEGKLGGEKEQNTMRPHLQVVNTGKVVVRTGEVEDVVWAVVDTVDTAQVGFVARGAVNVLEVSAETFTKYSCAERSGLVAARRRAKELGWNAAINHNPTGTKYGNVWSPCRIKLK